MKSFTHLCVVRAIVASLVPRAAWPLLIVGLICLTGGDAADADIVYFTDQSAGVYQVTAGGTPSVFVAATGDGQTGNHLNQPLGLAIDSGGNLYVSNVNNGDIVKIAPDATTRIFSHTDTTSSLYDGIAVDRAGNVYAAERNNGVVVEITPTGSITTLASGLFRPDVLAVDNVGTVYSANEDNTITKITPGGVAGTFVRGLSGGLAVDASGNLYVSSGHTIQKFLPNGDSSTFASGLQTPSSLAFGSNGDLYVSDYGTNTVVIVNPSGASSTFSQFIPNGGQIAVRTTPEPLGGGILSVFAFSVLRRHRRSQ